MKNTTQEVIEFNPETLSTYLQDGYRVVREIRPVSGFGSIYLILEKEHDNSDKIEIGDKVALEFHSGATELHKGPTDGMIGILNELSEPGEFPYCKISGKLIDLAGEGYTTRMYLIKKGGR